MTGMAGGRDMGGRLVGELGVTLDCQSEDVKKPLRRHAPQGIDVYFDNVGGAILDGALANLARGARIVICGAIRQQS
ncbi:MAG: zinc-binding dehydrogenase, partial [Burkholderiaceae bacterium]